MRVCLMIEGQEGVTWEQWLALAPRRRERRPRRALPLRPLPLDRPRRPGRLARRLGDARRRSPPAPSGSGSGRWSRPSRSGRASVLAKNVVDRRPHLGRPRRARDRRRLVRGRARRVRLPVPDRPASGSTSSTGSSRRSTRQWTDGRRHLAEAACSSRARRSSSAAPRSRAPCARPSASPTSTTPSSPTVDEARERKRDPRRSRARGRPRAAALLDDDRLRRRPRRGELDERAARVRASHAATTRRRSRARSTRSSTRLREYEAVGVERVMLQHLVHEDVEMVAVLGEVAARLR